MECSLTHPDSLYGTTNGSASGSFHMVSASLNLTAVVHVLRYTSLFRSRLSGLVIVSTYMLQHHARPG